MGSGHQHQCGGLPPPHFVHEMETPLLMAFGDDDGVVEPWQGTEFYNFARRAEKEMVLIVYEGENHSFTREPNQIDYHRRILEWFGHFLKGEPAPTWITDGIPYEGLEEEKRRIRRDADGEDSEPGEVVAWPACPDDSDVLVVTL